jgi:DNA-binding LytR/AlgR family response regulator
MPELSGIQLAKLINKKSEIVFVTAYPEFALEGFDLEAGDYLLKPVSFERFVQAAEKVKNKLFAKSNPNDEGKWIVLKSGTYLYRVLADDIMFLEKESNYVTVHTRKKKILVRMNMNEVFDIFPQEKFVQVHKSFVVALNAIDYINSDIIHIQSNEIPISRTFRDELMNRFYSSFPGT